MERMYTALIEMECVSLDGTTLQLVKNNKDFSKHCDTAIILQNEIGEQIHIHLTHSMKSVLAEALLKGEVLWD